jgi:hypothetical protein
VCCLLVQVGLLVATLQLDASMLMRAFDLGFCDAFMPPEIYEECETAAKHAAAGKVSLSTARPLAVGPQYMPTAVPCNTLVPC